MNYKIYVNSEEIDKILASLRNILIRLEKTIDNQKNINSNMHNAWSGTTGDAAYDAMKKHEEKYTGYIAGLKKRIAFLEAVKNAYTELDINFIKKLEENINTEV